MLTKTSKRGFVVSLAMATMLLGTAGVVHGEGIVQKASKDAAKGMIKGVQQELNSPEMVHSAKQVTKGVVDGVSDAAPLVTSQIANQANINRKAIGKVARQVTVDAASGVMGVTMHEMNKALGPKGDGPMADSMVAMTERMTTANVRAMVNELRPDPATMEKMMAASVRGAMSEMHFNFSVWPMVLAFALGGVSTLLCGVGLMLLYMLFQRRSVVVAEPVSSRLRAGQPVFSAS